MADRVLLRMRHRIRRGGLRRGGSVLLAYSLLASGSASLPARRLLFPSAHAATLAKPLIVVFAGAPPPGNGPETGVTAERQPDGLSEGSRIRMAARAVRDRLNESGVAEAVLYDPESPLFERAVLDARLNLPDPAHPGPADRLTIGKAIGALSVAVVTAAPRKDKPGSLEVTLDAVEVPTQKTFSTSVSAAGGAVVSLVVGGVAAGTIPNPDGSMPPVKLDKNAWASASNTLVVRYLAGPLGDYTRSLAPSTVQPPPPKPAPDPTAAVPASPQPIAAADAPRTARNPDAARLGAPPAAAASPRLPTPVPDTAAPKAPYDSSQDAVDLAEQRATALTAGGDVPGAITVLRRAVDEAPRSLKLRTALARAYVAAGRSGDAVAEARRALTVASPGGDRAARMEMAKLLADEYAKSGDTTAARQAYQDLLAAQPGAQWIRVALGDLLLKQGDVDGAESAYQTVLAAEPSNHDALLGIARVQAARGDFNAAIDAVAKSGADPLARLSAASLLFDDIASKTADAVMQNRAAFDGGQLTREAFFNATTKHAERAANLLTLLQSAAPPPSAAAAVTRPYKHRVFAATLLSQAIDGMVNYLQKDDADSAEQAAVLIGEFRKELSAAQAPAASGPNAAASAAAASTP